MRRRKGYLSTFKLLLLSLLASAQGVKKDSVSSSKPTAADSVVLRAVTYRYGLFTGLEYGKFIENAFKEDRQRYEVFTRVRLYRRWHLEGAYGRETALFHQVERSGWKIQVQGPYLRIGFDYAFFQADYNTEDNVCLGLRYGHSRFDQTIQQYAIRTKGGRYNQTGSLPTSSVATDWFGIVLGAQVALFKTGFYLGIALNPRFILHEAPLDDIKNLYTPGFGENINGRSFDYQATLAYRIPLFTHTVKMRVKTKP